MHIVHLKKFLSNDSSTREVQNFSIASQIVAGNYPFSNPLVKRV